MNNEQLDKHLGKIVKKYNETALANERSHQAQFVETDRETIEADMHQARLGAKVRVVRGANDKQVGGTHYKNMGVEPWAVIDTWPLDQRVGYYRGSALKYLMRMGSKDEAAQEIGKGVHYLEKLLEVLKEQRDE